MEPTRVSPSAERVALLLSFLGRHPDQRFTMSTLARELDMNKATTHTLLQTLTKHGLLLRHPDEKAYRLGPALVGLGESAALDEHEAADFAHAEMRRLSEELGLMCWVGAAVGEEIVILARVSPDSRLRGHPRIGQRFPFVAPVGAVFVAWAPLSEVTAWIERAGATGLDAAEYYHRELRTIRERGFAVNLLPMAGSELAEMIESESERENTDSVPAISQQLLTQFPANEPESGVVNLIAPVFHADGRVLLSLTIEARVEGPDVDLLAYGRRLLQGADAVTESIHGASPDGWPPDEQ